MTGVAEHLYQPQRTLKASIHCRGIGLHSGLRIGMTLHAGAPDSGIVFRRSDAGGAEIAASWRNVGDSALCTSIVAGDLSIGTIEHLMAAFAGLAVDNAVVELDGPEVPVMDGSAAPFVFLIECAGLIDQPAPRRAIKILRPVSVGARGKSAVLLPAENFRLSFAIDFASSAIRRQEITVTPVPASFKEQISRARTFGFLHEVDQMRAAGLALGGSLENAVVISGDHVLNEEGLRYRDEFVRHKVLDAIGDLYLAGAPIIGHFRGVRSGHSLNRELVKQVFADPANWCATTVPAAGEEEWEPPRRARA